jgi:very-short-patch-repair endonuclease
VSKPIGAPKRSKMHVAIRDLLKETFPSFKVFEEYPVDVGRRTLPVDLCVSDLKLCVECHGRQHFEWVPHFHKTKEDFVAQQTRDRQKKQAIINAGWALLTIRFDEYEKLNKTKLAKLITAALTEKQDESD